MLKDKIISIYKEEYGIEQGIEPEFDEIFTPGIISYILVSKQYHGNNNAQHVYMLIRDIARNIVEQKNQIGKKNFDFLFSKNFLSLELLKLSRGLDGNIFLKNYLGLSVSEYDIAHELIEQEKPCSFNFIRNSVNNLRDYLEIKESKGVKDPYAFAVLAGSYLEMAFDIYRKREDIQSPIENIKEYMQIALDNMDKSIEITTERNYKVRNFQRYFARRLYNFCGLTKRFMFPLDMNYHNDLSDITSNLLERFELEHTFKEKITGKLISA